MCVIPIRGFVKLKKIREKLGGGWVITSPNSDFYFFLEILFFYTFLCFFMFPKKKLDRAVGGWELTDLSFSRIFGFF